MPRSLSIAASEDLNHPRQEFQTPSSARPVTASASRLFPPVAPSECDQRLHRALDQDPQDCIRVSTTRASQADRLSEDAGGIGSASSKTLGTPDQVIDSGKRT